MHRHVCKIIHGLSSDVLSQILQMLKPSLNPRSINPCYIQYRYSGACAISARYGSSICHGWLPNGRATRLSPHTTLSNSPPPSRKPVLPSFELRQRDTPDSSRRRLDSSWVVSQSQACSAAQCIGSWHRLTLQLLLSPVSTSGRGRRCGTTFCCRARWTLANGMPGELRAS